MRAPDPLDEVCALLPDGAAFARALPGPFRRALRLHPSRGTPSGWGALEAVPWGAAGRWHEAAIDPATRLDYHTGLAYPQDAASQLPVALLAPRPGETVIDCCAAPGSKSTQIGLALGDRGLLVCCDAAAPRRAVLAENLGRQGIACAVVTPMPLATLAERHPGCADAVLVDAPCSGHEPRSARQVARMQAVQCALLDVAGELVRPGGRLVYSTCTPYLQEDEAAINAWLGARPDWRVEPALPSGCDADLMGLGGVRLWPQRQGTEPFFAIRLRAPDDQVVGADLRGHDPEPDPLGLALLRALPGDGASLRCWRRGGLLLAGTEEAAACALPSEARGLLLGHVDGERLRLAPWGVQALIARGAPATAIAHDHACRLWAGEAEGPVEAWLRTEHGAPLGATDRNGRLLLPSRLRRAELR